MVQIFILLSHLCRIFRLLVDQELIALNRHFLLASLSLKVHLEVLRDALLRTIYALVLLVLNSDALDVCHGRIKVFLHDLVLVFIRLSRVADLVSH
jgi:hypothetical protein